MEQVLIYTRCFLSPLKAPPIQDELYPFYFNLFNFIILYNYFYKFTNHDYKYLRNYQILKIK